MQDLTSTFPFLLPTSRFLRIQGCERWRRTQCCFTLRARRPSASDEVWLQSLISHVDGNIISWQPSCGLRLHHGEVFTKRLLIFPDNTAVGFIYSLSSLYIAAHHTHDNVRDNLISVTCRPLSYFMSANLKGRRRKPAALVQRDISIFICAVGRFTVKGIRSSSGLCRKERLTFSQGTISSFIRLTMENHHLFSLLQASGLGRECIVSQEKHTHANKEWWEI